MGLPAFRDIKSKETLLKPLPMNEIYKIIGNAVRENRYGDEWKLGDMFEVIRELIDYINAGRWHDWKYDLNAIHDWSDYQELIIELSAQKFNTQMKLTVKKEILTEEFMEDEDITDVLMAFFDQAQQNINQWNNISAYHKPLIVEKPPFADVMKFAFEEFEMQFEKDYMFYKDHGYFNNYAEYELEKEVFPDEVFSYEVIDEILIREQFGPHWMMNDFKILGMDHRYGYMLIDPYIMTNNIGVCFKPSEIEIDSSQAKHKDEWEQFFEEEVNKYYDAVVQWNKIVKGG